MSKYTVQTTSYDDGEAEYDAVDYPAQVIANADRDNASIVALCPDKEIAEHLQKLLEANPLDESAGERVVP